MFVNVQLNPNKNPRDHSSGIFLYNSAYFLYFIGTSTNSIIAFRYFASETILKHFEVYITPSIRYCSESFPKNFSLYINGYTMYNISNLPQRKTQGKVNTIKTGMMYNA